MHNKSEEEIKNKFYVGCIVRHKVSNSYGKVLRHGVCGDIDCCEEGCEIVILWHDGGTSYYTNHTDDLEVVIMNGLFYANKTYENV